MRRRSRPLLLVLCHNSAYSRVAGVTAPARSFTRSPPLRLLSRSSTLRQHALLPEPANSLSPLEYIYTAYQSALSFRSTTWQFPLFGSPRVCSPLVTVLSSRDTWKILLFFLFFKHIASITELLFFAIDITRDISCQSDTRMLRQRLKEKHALDNSLLFFLQYCFIFYFLFIYFIIFLFLTIDSRGLVFGDRWIFDVGEYGAKRDNWVMRLMRQIVIF